MCNLDVIAMTPEEEFSWWLNNSMNDPGFVITLVIFGAVFLLLLCVLTLFAVMLVRYFKSKSSKPSEVPDGSVHIVPFLSSILASMMFIFGAMIVIMYCFFNGFVPMGTFPYTVSVWYTVAMCVLFGIALGFRPNAGKVFIFWNTVCLVVTALFVFSVIYFRLFMWFLWGSVEVLG